MIIDAHSHIGKDYMQEECKLSSYVEYLKKVGIDMGLVMPVPSPIYTVTRRGSNCILKTLSFKYDEYKQSFNYYTAVIQENGEEQIRAVIKNPYKYFNYKYYQEIKSNDDETIRLEFVPIIHPKFDTIQYLDKLVGDMNPIAFKIHGIGAGISTEDMSEGIIRFLQEKRIPLILHTDYDNLESGNKKERMILRNKNKASNWARFLKTNNLKGVLNHGAVLDKEAIDIVNESDNIILAIGPDLDMNAFPNRLMVDRKILEQFGYLEILRRWVRPDKLLFDVDYNWNMDRNTRELDYGCVERVNNTWLNLEDRKRIFSENALNFFNIRDRCKIASENEKEKQ